MTTLEERLRARRTDAIAARPPEVTAALEAGVAAVRSAGIAERALRSGDVAPTFTLPDATGRPVDLTALLAAGPVILCFYRGGWCPYCSLELRAYAALVPEMAALGVSFVAISPETPDASSTTAEREGLPFAVLSDVGGSVGAAFRLVHPIEPDVREIYARQGHDLPGRQDVSAADVALPLPATYLVAPDGTIRFAFVSPDYTERAEPSEVLAAARRLIAEGHAAE